MQLLSCKDYRYFLVILDRINRFCFFLKNYSLARTIIDFVLHLLFLLIGIPTKFVIDRITNLTSFFYNTTETSLGIQHSFTSSDSSNVNFFVPTTAPSKNLWLSHSDSHNYDEFVFCGCRNEKNLILKRIKKWLYTLLYMKLPITIVKLKIMKTCSYIHGKLYNKISLYYIITNNKYSNKNSFPDIFCNSLYMKTSIWAF